jgi:hypothetical protein
MILKTVLARSRKRTAVLPHLTNESLVLVQKYRGAPKDGHRGKKETIVVNLERRHPAKKKLSW